MKNLTLLARTTLQRVLALIRREAYLFTSLAIVLASGLIAGLLIFSTTSKTSNDGVVIVDTPCLTEASVHVSFDISDSKPFIRLLIIPRSEQAGWWQGSTIECPYFGIKAPSEITAVRTPKLDGPISYGWKYYSLAEFTSEYGQNQVVKNSKSDLVTSGCDEAKCWEPDTRYEMHRFVATEIAMNSKKAIAFAPGNLRVLDLFVESLGVDSSYGVTKIDLQTIVSNGYSAKSRADKSGSLSLQSSLVMGRERNLALAETSPTQMQIGSAIGSKFRDSETARGSIVKYDFPLIESSTDGLKYSSHLELSSLMRASVEDLSKKNAREYLIFIAAAIFGMASSAMFEILVQRGLKSS
jgi:hypothetical protein